MNERFYTPEFVETSDQNKNNPIVNWDTYNSTPPAGCGSYRRDAGEPGRC